MKGSRLDITLFLLCVPFFFLHPVATYGQHLYYSNGYYFEQYSKGLKDADLCSLLQDSKGYIWAGSSGALFRYDGYSFSMFEPRQDMPYAKKIKGKRITALEEDLSGNLWFGTSDSGLSRFEPEANQFFHYPFVADDPGSITEGPVTSIVCDKEGILWVGTTKGLNSVTFDPAQPDSIRVTHFYEEEGKNGSFSPLHLLGNNIRDLYLDQNQNLWIGTNKGLSKLALELSKDKGAPKTYLFEHFLPSDTDTTTIHFDYITSINKGLPGTIWIAGVKKGINVCLDLYNPETGKFHALPFKDPLSNTITCIAQTQNGHLWLGTFGGGLKKIMVPNLYQRLQTEGLSPVGYDTFSFKYWGLMTQNYIRVLLVDRSGALWVGTNYCYLYKFPLSRSGFQYYEIPTVASEVPQITNFMEDRRGFLWLTTTEHGVFRWDKQTNDYIHYQHDPENSKSIADNATDFIFEDTRGRIWLGTKKGLNRFDPQTGFFYNYNGVANAPTKQLVGIFEDSNGILWLASFYEGLFIMDPEQDKFWHYEKNADDVNGFNAKLIVQILQDSEGTIWISDFGLFKVVYPPGGNLDYGNLTFQYLALGGHEPIVQIFIDRQKRFWASGDPEGFYLIDTKEEKIVKTYAQKQGHQLVGGGVFGIKEDGGGNLWFFGGSGVEKFDPEKETFELFDETCGFSFSPSGRNAAENKEGWYYTKAINNGFHIFHPDSIHSNKIPPDVLITQFRLFNQIVQPGQNAPLSQHISKTKKIPLKHNQNNIAFEYVGLHYDRTEKIQYAYKMQGIDEDWVSVGAERIARYPKLAPGEYTFKVKAANADGVWNEEGASIAIRVLKPWWGTWLAFVLYAAGLAGIVYFLYSKEVRNKLQKAEARRLAELDEVKTKLYTNITHEFRTPLTIILGMADQIKSNPKDWFSEGLQMIKRSGKNLLNLVNQMLDLSKLESGTMPVHQVQGDIIVYLKYLFESFHSMAESKEISLEFISDQENLLMDYDPDKMLNIVFNLMSNAIKYTPRGGTITMQTAQQKHSGLQLEIKISDTGIGISEANLPHIFDRFYQAASGENKAGGTGVGLAIVKELIALMKGSISVKSKMGEGTEFTVLLPITQKAALSEVPLPLGIKEQLPYELPSEGILQDEQIIKSEEQPILLIVEDNADVVTYLSSFLQQEYRLLTAHNGTEGIEQAIENIPDIILSDVMMPVMDGYELCRALKTDERTSHIPIILLTAKADTSSKFEGLELGADAYLTKPVIRQELELRLRKLLESRKRLQEYYSKIYPARQQEEPYVREDSFMKKLHEILESHLEDETFDIKALCRSLYISRMQLHRKIKALTGKSTSHYVRSLRLRKAKTLLLSTDKTITEIAYEVGFNSQSYFSSSFLEEYGQSPQEYRQ